MVRFIQKLSGLLIVSLLFTVSANSAEITATVDRNPIPVGESFRFVLDARGSIDEEPDFSELQKKFRVLNTSQSSNFRLINGSITRNKTWTMVLMLDKPGSYTIPEIKFGKDKSEAIVVEVVKNTIKQGDNQQAAIYLEIEVEPKTVYVQQQVIYTIKLFRRIRLANASISEPISENNQAIISKFGDDTDKKVVINGVGYSVIERKYAIFPQKSGVLKIAPITFETQLVRNNRQRSFFNTDPFNAQGTIKRIESKAVEIQVNSVPIAFIKKYPDAAWLPVDSLEITEAWSGDIKKFTSGEPITRTINLTAQNLSAAQLPDIRFSTPKNINTYPDVPVVKELNNLKGLTAGKQFKTALLPTKVGDFLLPKIEIPWWNTNTDTIEISTLPAHKIHVGAASDQNEINKLKLNDTISNPQDNTDSENKIENLNSSTLDNNLLKQPTSPVWVIVSSLFGLLWLITFYLYLRLRSKTRLFSQTSETELQDTPVSTKEIKVACLSNDATLCRQLLIKWANTKTKSDRFTNLSSLLPHTEQNLRQYIEELEQHLYSNKSKDWTGDDLWAAFKLNQPDLGTRSKQKFSNPNLSSLYANYD